MLPVVGFLTQSDFCVAEALYLLLGNQIHSIHAILPLIGLLVFWRDVETLQLDFLLGLPFVFPLGSAEVYDFHEIVPFLLVEFVAESDE